MTKEIPIAGGLVALVDDQDYELVSGYSWSVLSGRQTKYAVAYVRGSFPDCRRVLMHRLIMAATDGVGVDHKNRNGLDCQRGNLRLATESQNKANTEKQRTANGKATTSAFKGVYWHRGGRKWLAQICVDGKRRYLGLFTSETDAAVAYNKAAIQAFGEFARTSAIQEVAS